MALTQTVLDQAWARHANLDVYEVRSKNYGFFNQAQKNGDVLVGRDVVKKKKSLDQDVVVAVLNKGHVGSNGGRVIGTIPTALGTSAKVTLATQTFQRHFSIQPMENYINEISYHRELARVMKELQLQLLGDIEAYIYATVNAARSQADNSGAYPIVLDAFQVPNTDYEDVLAQIDAIYRTNDYAGAQIKIVANPMYAAVVSKILEFSANNSQNKSMRVVGKDINFSSAITPAGKHELMVSTDMGYEIMNFNEPDAVMKTRKDEAEYKETINLPLLGMKFGLYAQKSYVANDAGSASTLMESYSVATDVTVVTPYLSTPATDPAPNTKFELLA